MTSRICIGHCSGKTGICLCYKLKQDKLIPMLLLNHTRHTFCYCKIMTGIPPAIAKSWQAYPLLLLNHDRSLPLPLLNHDMPTSLLLLWQDRSALLLLLNPDRPTPLFLIFFFDPIFFLLVRKSIGGFYNNIITWITLQNNCMVKMD